MDKAKQSTAEGLENTRQTVAGQTTMDKAKNTMQEGKAKMGMGGEQSYTERAKEAMQQTCDKASNLMEKGKEKLGMGGERR